MDVKTDVADNIIFKKHKINLKVLLSQKYLILMSLPWVIFIFIFSYIPLWGWSMAFQDYKPTKSIFDQTWVGFKHFEALFADEMFYHVLRNTLAMSLMSFLGFVVPIVFALFLNEVKNVFFKRTVQTISYLPHFVSIVIIASLTSTMFQTDGGAINSILMIFGINKDNVNLLTEPMLFWVIITFVGIWKETGWGAIIYLAAISGIDQEVYEAARVDGASRLRQIWHITLPGIMPTVIVLLILKVGGIINAGFELQMLLQNAMTMDYSQTLDYYTLSYGIGMSRYSFGTAIGIFKTVVSVILVLSTNKLAKKFGEGGIV